MDYTFSDVSRHLEAVLDLVPWKEMAQSDFVSFVAHANILPEPMLLSASLTIMGEALANPERLTKSAFLLETDPNTAKTELTRAMEQARTKLEGAKESPTPRSRSQESRSRSQVREKADQAEAGGGAPEEADGGGQQAQ